MTIKQQGGIFGRNPTFNKVNVDDSLLINTSEITADVSAGDTVLQISGATGGTGVAPELVLYNSDGNDGALSSISFGGFRSGNAGAVGRISSNRLGIITFGNNDAANNQDTVTDRLTIEEGGDVTVETGNLIIGTSGKGIDFSATSGTGTSELFDDYEEGTWTPTLTSGPTLSAAVGRYTKIGNTVYVMAKISRNDAAANTNAFELGGLPYTPDNSNPTSANGLGVAASYNGGSDRRTGIINSSNGNTVLIIKTGTAVNVTYDDFIANTRTAELKWFYYT